MIVINDNFRMMKNGEIYEGGMSRNAAILNWLKRNDAQYEELKLNRNRAINAIVVLKCLLFSKRKTILSFYPTVGIPINKNGVLGFLARIIYFTSISISSRNNQLVFDICDLKYEQSIDLNLEPERRKAIKNCEKVLFTGRYDFIFASESMRKYAVDKYTLEEFHTFTLPNGGFEKKRKVENNESIIKYVYAGTLNQGRGIEEMIDAFPENEKIHLFLLGVGGEWIKEKSNVHYVGKLEEKEAFAFVNQCDVGLIPYDDSKLYYNLAYPTKLSFYITAGISFLGTPVKEIIKVHETYKIGFVAPLKDWNHIFSSLSKNSLVQDREKINLVNNLFTWESCCERCVFFKDFIRSYTVTSESE